MLMEVDGFLLLWLAPSVLLAQVISPGLGLSQSWCILQSHTGILMAPGSEASWVGSVHGGPYRGCLEASDPSSSQPPTSLHSYQHTEFSQESSSSSPSQIRILSTGRGLDIQSHHLLGSTNLSFLRPRQPLTWLILDIWTQPRLKSWEISSKLNHLHEPLFPHLLQRGW